MNIPEFSVKRKITVLMMILIVMLFGILAFFHLGLDMMPELEYPVVSVITTYEGVSSEDVENLITRQVEEVVSSVKNVKNVSSLSQEGISAVIVEFEWGVNLDFAAQDVREKLSWLTDYLPEDADSPLVVKFNTSDYPILYYGVTGMENTHVLREYLDDNIKPRLERIDGVASIFILGGLEREIDIFVDREKLQAFSLSMDQIISKLALENVNVSGGHVIKGSTEYLVRTIGEYKDIKEISDTIVSMGSGAPVYLKDIASVKDTYKEIRNRARTNRRPSVIMMVMKQAGKNSVTVTNKITGTLDELKIRMPKDIVFYPVMDQARIIKTVTRNTGQNALAGAILAIAMVFLFLWNWRPTLTIAVAVPLSGITTAIGLYAFDYTLNIMTLGGMALGVGMLVDNAVVVIENIFRHQEEGESPDMAAAKGAQEVGMAITASTLTTISVFLPMTLSSGIAGRLSRPLAVTVALALIASLFVALTIVPMLSSVLARGRKGRQKMKSRADTFFSAIKSQYANLLRWGLAWRKTVIFFSLAAFIGGLGLIRFLGTEFMPQEDFPILALRANLPTGTSLEETNRTIRCIEEIILKQPETLFCTSFVGLSRESKVDAAWGTGPADVNEAVIYTRLADKEDRVRSSEDILDDVRKQLPVIKGAVFDFFDIQQVFLGSSGGNSPVAVKVFGKELEKLKDVSDHFAEKCADIEGLRDIDTSLKLGKPELQVIVDRELASQTGLSVGQVAQAVKAGFLGIISTRYRIGGDEYDMRVRFKEQDRKTIDDVKNIPLATRRGNHIPLYQIARIEERMGPVKIVREDQERKVTITANTYKRDIGSIVNDIKKAEAQIAIPEGYFVEYGGTYQDMEEAFTSLTYALIIAIILIYMIMAAQFESLKHPLVIMMTVPLSVIGVVIGLFVFGKTLSVPAFMGILILSGVVVNNGIVMIDYINQLRHRGMDAYEAVIEGASVRLRPILITTFTTVFGMLPMALSQTQGSELRSPMAVAVGCGLLFSMFLTLLVIPVVYSVFDRIKK
ncbi:MAG: efflux RND transporter permease subunit [Syntrophales bacterium]|jgi:HAE1 family hydrophobic/amphiphilic exporter-1|nr:efflux RND transporter permease subunit [Syntrophales bacterium]MDY0044045.1 efflux RND transporter permease subunit [Syntrophales bacterium]